LFVYTADPRHRPSFPTRRSSDLLRCACGWSHSAVPLHRVASVAFEHEQSDNFTPEQRKQRAMTRILDRFRDPSTYAQTIRAIGTDRKSTRLNSSHQIISYAVFCL